VPVPDEVRVGIIGAGHIGATVGRLLAGADHDVMLSYARDPEQLEARATEIGPKASAGTVAEAAAFGPVVLLSVPWERIDEVLAEAGDVSGKVVIDTTNPFAGGGLVELPAGATSAQVNAARMPAAHVVKAFNTLTAGFLAESAGRAGDDRVVIFYSGDDTEANTTAGGLIEDAGFVPVRIGGLADSAPMEMPRRAGAVVGEEFHLADAWDFVDELPR
jgi:hypothetical protein